MGCYTNQLLFLVLIYLSTVQPSYQQSCSGPAAKVGNRCNFDDEGTELCCSVKGAYCSPTTGLCVCPLGRAGPMCDQACPLNSDGTGCEIICGNNPCYDRGRCRDTGNQCICNSQFEGDNCERCIVGFRGDYCDISCPVASDDVSCETDCTRNKCDHFGLCTQVEEGCLCKKGSKGPNCDIACPISDALQRCELSCIDNDCLGSMTCAETATGCQCQSRSYGPTCSRTCLIPGWTGLDCIIPCPVANDHQSCLKDCRDSPCFELNTCEQTAIDCHCLPGYVGENCNLCSPPQVQGECREFCEFDDHACLTGHCDITTGDCRCPDGLSGENCQFCHDSYLGGCSTFCGSDCYGEKQVCNKITKSCECAIGFSGEDCRNCDPDTHPERCMSYCVDSCGDNIQCDTVTRQCICKDGYSGSDCEYCHPASHENQCREYCEVGGYACELSSQCLTTTRYCVCPYGQYGASCGYCNPDVHPYQCIDLCNPICMGKFQVCDVRESKCRCLAHFTGEDCDMCIPSTHQSNCQNFCPQDCPPKTYCNTNTGQCTCQNGYLGSGCIYCRPDLNPQRCTQHCSYACEKGYCNTLTRQCECYEHFQGPDCSLCEPNESNYFCRQFCDVRCQNGGLCDVYDGSCYCTNTVFSGRDCSLCNKTLENGECERRCGQHCENGGACNTVSLTCECPPGYVLGDCSWCTPDEEPNRCSQHCAVECLNSAHCDTQNNMCVCQDNFTGSDCGMCIPRLHREKCKNFCGVECQNNATCDTQHRTCVCPPGYNGTDCSQVCTECRVRVCVDCEGVTDAPTISAAGVIKTDDPQYGTLNNQTLLIGVSSAVGFILVIIISILIFSVCKKGNKKERSSSTQGMMTADHVPMMNGQGQNYQPKVDNNRYSQANILMRTRSMSGHDEYHNGVCDDNQGTMDSDLYAYAHASTLEMQSRADDTPVRFSDDHSQTYAYASPQEMLTQTSSDDNAQTYAYATPDQGTNHEEPYNSLDFNPRKSSLPVEINQEYNRLQIGLSPPSQTGISPPRGISPPHGISPPRGVSPPQPLPKPARVKANTYEDVPTESIAEPSENPPTYAHVNKAPVVKAKPSLPHRTSSMKIKEDVFSGDPDSAPMSPRYTVVEPDLSESESEEVNGESDFGPSSPLYNDKTGYKYPANDETNDSPEKSRMPPYAKVNKNRNKKSTKTKVKAAPEVYDKLQRPLTTFTIEDDDETEEQLGEYSHLIANPHLKKGYSKLDYGPIPTNRPNPKPTPQFMSANMYAELQVNYPEN